jgi:uncharacterized RDD family membrane protein YckC
VRADDDDQGLDRHNRVDRHAHHTGRGRHENGNDLVSIGHDATLERGQTADEVVSVFGSSTSDGDAEDVVSVLGDTRVTGSVSDSAVAVLGNTYIDSKVDGDAVAVLGSMELGPHAEIRGDAVVVGGTLQRDPAAIVHGSVQNVFAGDFGSVAWLRSWVHHCLLYGRPLAFAPGLGWAWGLAFAFLALYVGLALLFRDGLTRCVRTFDAQPGQTVLAALIATLLTPVIVVLLCVTVIGIAGVPFIMAGLFCAGLFGKAVMLAWLGGRMTGGRAVTSTNHPAAAVAVGGVLVLILYVVPILGFVVFQLLGFLGLGAVVYTLILAARSHQAAKQGARSPAGSAGAARAAGAAAAADIAPAASAPPISGAALDSSPAQPGTAAPEGSAAPSSGAASASDPRGPAPAAEAPRAQPQEQPRVQAASITAALPRAGFWIRMVALLLDAVLIGFLMHVLHHVADVELLVLATYGAVMWKLRGTTVGGIVFDLRVVRLDGRDIDWETAIIRALSCFLSLAVAGLGFFWIAFDDQKQAWHDKIAGTVVVRVAKGAPLV